MSASTVGAGDTREGSPSYIGAVGAREGSAVLSAWGCGAAVVSGVLLEGRALGLEEAVGPSDPLCVGRNALLVGSLAGKLNRFPLLKKVSGQYFGFGNLCLVERRPLSSCWVHVG